MSDKPAPFDYEGFKKSVTDGYLKADIPEGSSPDEAEIIRIAAHFAVAHGEVAAVVMKLLTEGVQAGALIRAVNMISISAVRNFIRMGSGPAGSISEEAGKSLFLFALNDYEQSLTAEEDDYVHGGTTRPGDFVGH